MLADQVVWITGASSGIGEALARRLLEEGASVVLTARRAELLEAFRAHSPVPERVHLLPGDLSDAAAIPDLAERAQALAGRVDILINNAGISQRTRALDTRLQDVRALMEINFFAPVALSNAVLPGMLERGRGRLVIVSSVAGYIATPIRSSYSASKFAVRGYFDSLRAELHGTGVGVTVVCPGYIRTEISQHALGPDGQEHGKVDGAIERGMPAERCADVIVRGLRKGKSEVHVGGPELMAIYANRLFPRLVERFLPSAAPQ